MKGLLYLPPEACMILVQKEDIEEKTSSGLYLPEKAQVRDTGTIVAIDRKYSDYLGKKVVFRQNFGEERKLNGNIYLYFRDFNSSIYYVLEDENKG